MSPEAQRIAIAEACGWRWCWCSGRVMSIPLAEGQPVTSIDNGPKRYMVAPDKDAGPCGHEGGTADMRLDEDATSKVPDYLGDLNAIHEAEATLIDQEIDRYRTDLWKCVGNEGYNFESCAPQLRLRRFISATAAQRAEAFLRTIGKWEDDS